MDKDIQDLVIRAKDIIISARRTAYRGVDRTQVVTNFIIGKLIVEQEQKGSKRADYGKHVLKILSGSLMKEFGRGFSLTNLKLMRQFYLMNMNRCLDPESNPAGKSRTLSDQFTEDKDDGSFFISNLSWSHHVFLMKLQNENERNFYEIESMKNDWSLRELKRQFDSSLYERIALSRDKDAVMGLSRQGQVLERPQDLFKEPYVLEFLGLREDMTYSENDIETAIIDKLEQFLLELGKGFLFEARQKRFTFDSDHFFVDLVFYNRILRCYVLLDLKIGKISHQDLGQMQMYVNFFDRYVRLKDENPTIGVILCREKNDAVVELTLPKDTNIYPARYQLYLPSKEELRNKLLEWSGRT